jgi:hypothetical protein
MIILRSFKSKLERILNMFIKLKISLPNMLIMRILKTLKIKLKLTLKKPKMELKKYISKLIKLGDKLMILIIKPLKLVKMLSKMGI